jgi:hypothetical protein
MRLLKRIWEWWVYTWDDLREILLFLGGVLLGIGVLVGVVTYGIYRGERYSCGRKADKMGLEHDYGFWTECRVEINGRYIDIDDYRVTEELVEG